MRKEVKRKSTIHITFLFNIQKGTVPAIPKDDFLKPIKPKRQIRARTFTDCVSSNFVQRHQNLNSNCFELPKAYSGALDIRSFQEQFQSGINCLIK